jgi:site-specific DNA-methyltransferase (adenine-specific)
MLKVNQIYHIDCVIGLQQIDDESVDMIINDPPYNISQEGADISRKHLNKASLRRTADIKMDFGQWDKFAGIDDFFNFTESWFAECARVLKPGGWIYIFFDKNRMGFFDLFLAPKYGIKQKNIFVWMKQNPTPSFRKTNWLSATEFVWIGTKGKSKIKNFLTQKQMYNYMLTPNKSAYGKTSHPTEKPEALISRFIKATTAEHDIVVDAFIGSGTTAVCAKKLRRRWIGFENNREYYEMALERVANTTVGRNITKFAIDEYAR